MSFVPPGFGYNAPTFAGGVGVEKQVWRDMRVGQELNSRWAGFGRLRLGAWVFPLWLVVTGAGLAAFATALPERWRFLNTPCAGAACEPGQPTRAGLELRARVGLPPGLYSSLLFSFNLLVPALIILVMGVVVWRKPGSRVAAALAFGGVTCSLLGGVHEAAALRGWLWPLDRLFGILAGTGLAFGLLAFPDGRFLPRRGRLLALPLLAAPFGVFFGSVGGAISTAGFMLTFPCALVPLTIRYRGTENVQHKQQLKWTLYGLGLLVFALLDSLLVSLLLPPAWNEPGAPGDLVTSLVAGGSILSFWLCLALAVLRYRLFDIDLVIRRTLLYGGLSAAVSAGYLLLVVGLPYLLRSPEGPVTWFVAALPVVFALGPLHGFFARWAVRTVPVTLGERPLSVPHASSARRGWLRFLWWGYGVVVFGLVLVGVPAVLEFRALPCTGAVCEPQGRLTAERLAALMAAGVSPTGYAYWSVFTQLLVPLCGFALFALTLWRRPANRAAHLLALGVLSCNALYPGSLTALAETYPWAGWLNAALVFVTASALLPALFAFPDGRFSPRWSPLLLIPNTLAALLLGLAVSPSPPPYLTRVLPTLGVWNLLIAAAAVAALVIRYRTALAADVRRQVWWVLVGACVATPLGLLLDAAVAAFGARPRPLLLLEVASTLNILFFLGCLAVAMLFYNLFDIGMVLRRALVYGGLTLGVGVLYGLLVALAGLLSLEGDNLLVSLVATGTVALLFGPLRARLQRGVNRLLYGQRSEPYRVVADLTERLGGLLEPARVFPVTVETVATALKLPYADIVLGSEPSTVARYGKAGAKTEDFPLAYANKKLGHLSVSPRPGEPQLSRTDRLLLTDLARQVSVSAHAFLLAADLERSRLHLVSAREEARRTLGNDLHDSVGHALAGLVRRAENAREVLEADPKRAAVLLAELADGGRSVARHVRGLAHQLHPPELELLGLVGAVQEVVTATDAVRVTLAAPDLPRLPAALEVAILYTVQEALYNVVRHARAQNCRVRLTLRRDIALGAPLAPVLELEIADDGCGLTPNDRPGLGLCSVQARAAELGGRCLIETSAEGGTRVLTQLPCPDC